MSNSSINIGSNRICGNNIGTGSTLYVCNNPFNTLNFKSISVAPNGGLSINSTGDTIIFSANTNSIGEANTGVNTGLGTGIFRSKVGDELRFRSLIGSGSVSISLIDSGSTLRISGSTNTTTAAGGEGQIQFNDGGTGSTLSASSDFVYSATTNSLTLGNGISSGCNSFAMGYVVSASGDFSFSQGINSEAIGCASTALGCCTYSIGNNSFTTGEYNSACGLNSFVQGCYSTTYANHSAILGGVNHSISVGNTGSTIIGGNNINLTGTDYVDTTAVANLAIIGEPTSGSSDQILIRNTTTGIIEYKSLSGVTGSDRFVSGATLSGGTLILSRTESLPDVTVDLSPLSGSSSGADGVVSGGTLNGSGELILERTESLGDVIIDLGALSGASTASNGLTLSGGDVQLGGTLTTTTTICTNNAYALNIGHTNTIDASAINSFIGGGRFNDLCSPNSAIVGGYNLTLCNGSSDSAMIGGNANNLCSSIRAAVIGGTSNNIDSSDFSGIFGGTSNNIDSASNNVVVGGNNNSIIESVGAAMIGARQSCIINEPSSFVGGSCNSTIVGGYGGTIGFARDSFILGGGQNIVITGGTSNGVFKSGIIASQIATISGSCGNSNTQLIMGSVCSHIINNNLTSRCGNNIIGGCSNTQYDALTSTIIASDSSMICRGSRTAIVGGINHDILISGGSNTSTNSVIVGGNGSTLSGTTNTVILGGSSVGIINGNYDNTAVVENLAIMTAPSAGGSNDLLTWESGTTGTGIIRKVTQASISDRRLKTNLLPINNALDGIVALNAYEYEFNDNVEPLSLVGQKKYGLIAQDVESIFPLVVSNNLKFGDETYKTIEYRELVPILIEAIKELNERIIQLETKDN